jgi:hypothetical protein
MMSANSLFSFEFFQGLHNKDDFFQRITDEAIARVKLLNHLVLLVLFSCCYGLVMGSYNGWQQAVSSGVKLPILFTLILFICFPAFFVIQTVIGSKLSLVQILSIIMTGFVLTTSIMLSFAPIVVFFMITGDNYSFIKLLHVAIFIFSGIFGMRTIVEALKFACEKKVVYPKTGVQVFRIWIIILAFVGAQLSWTLRPFIGAKGLPFTVFREQQGNFYQNIFSSVGQMFEGEKRQRARFGDPSAGPDRPASDDQNAENTEPEQPAAEAENR